MGLEGEMRAFQVVLEGSVLEGSVNLWELFPVLLLKQMRSSISLFKSFHVPSHSMIKPVSTDMMCMAL